MLCSVSEMAGVRQVSGVLCSVSETWPLKEEDMAMIWWMCNMRLKD